MPKKKKKDGADLTLPEIYGFQESHLLLLVDWNNLLRNFQFLSHTSHPIPTMQQLKREQEMLPLIKERDE